MRLSLDEILEIELMLDLKPYKNELKMVIDALDLHEDKKYLSVGIGGSRFPLIAALHGLKVTAIDVDKIDILQYQRKISDSLLTYLQRSGGNLELLNYGLEDSKIILPSTVVPPPIELYGKFDIIECINVYPDGEGIYDPTNTDLKEIAQQLLSLGSRMSTYFVCMYRESTVKEDRLVKAIMEQVTASRRRLSIVGTDFFTGYNDWISKGIILKVY